MQKLFKEAYLPIPLTSSCYNLTGFKLGQEYFYDRRLRIMGARSACKTFERVSSSLKFILISSFKVKFVLKLPTFSLRNGRGRSQVRFAPSSPRWIKTLLLVRENLVLSTVAT